MHLPSDMKNSSSNYSKPLSKVLIPVLKLYLVRALVFLDFKHRCIFSLNDDHSNCISENLEIYMYQDNKGQPQQGGQNNQSGQQGQQPGKNPGQQTQQPSEKPGQGSDKS